MVARRIDRARSALRIADAFDARGRAAYDEEVLIGDLRSHEPEDVCVQPVWAHFKAFVRFKGKLQLAYRSGHLMLT